MLERLAVALVPVSDQIGVEHGRPAHATLEEGEVESGKAPRHAAQEERLADRVAGGGEVTDMVVGEVGRRQAQALASEAGVEGGRDAQLDALGPELVVVVRAVEPERIVPGGESRHLGILRADRLHGARHEAAEHRDLEAQLRGVLQLLDGFVGGVHGDDRGRRHPIGEVAEAVGGVHVEGPARGATLRVVGDARHAQSGCRI